MTKEDKGKPLANKVKDLFEDSTTEMIRTGLYIRKDTLDKLKEVGKETGRSVNEIINKVLVKFLEG